MDTCNISCEIPTIIANPPTNRCYTCVSTPESTNTYPLIRYNTLKRIQNTVMVSSSQYTNELSALTATPRRFPTWNNMSDRDIPHIQKAYSSTILSSYRPGAMSPGGIGCDVKHGSYVRYLNRLKGRKCLRKEPVPPTFDIDYIPFSIAHPVYGDKRVKTSVVNCSPCT